MCDPSTDRPLFVTRCIGILCVCEVSCILCVCAPMTHTQTHTELACEACKEAGKAHECVHLLHLVPSWQSAERHRKLKIMMQDRPGKHTFRMRVKRQDTDNIVLFFVFLQI